MLQKLKTILPGSETQIFSSDLNCHDLPRPHTFILFNNTALLSNSRSDKEAQRWAVWTAVAEKSGFPQQALCELGGDGARSS